LLKFFFFFIKKKKDISKKSLSNQTIFFCGWVCMIN